MRLPPIHAVSQTDIYVSGDVTIHDQAVVASGVILKASPNSQIIIGEGVCLGMGVVISAIDGRIEIFSGAVLGAGVLVIGSLKIGQNACIGASSTLMNVSVEAMAIIPSGSLVGDTSRQVAIPPIAEFRDIPPYSADSEKYKGTAPDDLWETPSVGSVTPVELTTQETSPEIVPVVGQVYINQLLLKLFPERQAFKRSQHDQS